METMDGKELFGMWMEDGKSGDAMGYFNAGNLKMFGDMGVPEDKEEALRLWMLGTRLAEKTGWSLLLDVDFGDVPDEQKRELVLKRLLGGEEKK